MLIILAVASCTGESHRSRTRVWDFSPEKVWEVGEAGGMEFGRPAEPRVAEDGRLYFHDFERRVSFILDGEGGFEGFFAEAGTGPGKVSRYMNCWVSRTKVIVGTPDKLHFFDLDGNFVKSVPNNLFVRFPLAFIDDHIVFMGPGALCNLPECTASIVRVNLDSGAEDEIYRFAISEKENQGFGGVIIGLTPQINMDYDSDSGMIFFARNDRYRILEADRDGTEKGSFGLERDRVPITTEVKRDHFESFGIPAENYENLLPLLPDELTYFHRIQVIGDLVYVFRTDELSRKIGRQDIDIFTKDGKYLYRGRIELPAGERYANPDQLRLTDGYIYVILGAGDEPRRVARYRVHMPD